MHLNHADVQTVPTCMLSNVVYLSAAILQLTHSLLHMCHGGIMAPVLPLCAWPLREEPLAHSDRSSLVVLDSDSLALEDTAAQRVRRSMAGEAGCPL
jgi:hypothetical protein